MYQIGLSSAINISWKYLKYYFSLWHWWLLILMILIPFIILIFSCSELGANSNNYVYYDCARHRVVETNFYKTFRRTAGKRDQGWDVDVSGGIFVMKRNNEAHIDLTQNQGKFNLEELEQRCKNLEKVGNRTPKQVKHQ